MRCPHCQAQNLDDARFCGVCGQATSATEPVSDPRLGEAPVMIGREIAGRYRVLAKLGEGGMGAVYRAEQISLKRSVAVKLLRPDVAASAMLLTRFNAEAEAVAKLSHPNTVNIYDFGQDTDGTLFIAMEFIEGKSLRSVIHEEAPLPLRRALGIAAQVAASLADAHGRSIIHRDLKPDNVMLQTRGRQRDVVRVLDFGIAKLRDDKRTQQMTQAGDMLGTPQYMAPEQIRAETIDGRTDVYALGCMIYEMITARLPFEAPTVMALLSKHLLEDPMPPAQRRPDLLIPPPLEHLVMAAMAKDPRARPPTMEAFGEQIAAVLHALPADTERASAGMVAPTMHTGMVTPQGAYPPTPSPSYVPPVHQPPPPQMYAPGTPPPAQSPYLPHAHAAAPYVPPQAPPMAAPRAAPKKSHAPLIGIALLLAAGAAVAIVLAVGSRKHADTPAPPAPGSDEKDEPDDKDEPEDLPTLPDVKLSPSDDPWAAPSSGGTANAPIATPSGTLPAGANLIAPPGFTRVDQPSAHALVDKQHGIAIMMGPITSTSDDPAQLAEEWASLTKVKLTGMTTVTSHGQAHTAAEFTGRGPQGAYYELGVAFLTPSYRVAVIVVAAQATANQSVFKSWVHQFFEHNIELP